VAYASACGGELQFAVFGRPLKSGSSTVKRNVIYLNQNTAPVETGAQPEGRPTVGPGFSRLRAFSPNQSRSGLK
jgi:hypothetical protein